MKINHIVRLGKKHKQTVSNWIGTMESFRQEFSAEIATHKAISPRDNTEAAVKYSEIKDNFKNKFDADSIQIGILPWSVSFNVHSLSEDEAKDFEAKVSHSLPVNLGSDQCTISDDKSLSDYVSEELNKSF